MTAADLIPAITHQWGKCWSQPQREEIRIFGSHALMSREIFLELKEYSGSNPSGVYEGKMWTRHDGVFDRAFLAHGGVPDWKLVWFENDPSKPEYCRIQSLLILLYVCGSDAGSSLPPAECCCPCPDCMMRRQGILPEQIDL